jgi:cytochrome c oxidase subunit 2
VSPDTAPGLHAVMSPYGSDAARIADLAWLLFIGGAVVFLIVGAALYLALFGSVRARKILSGNSVIAIGGIAFPVVVLTALLTYGIWVMRANMADPSQQALRIEVEGQQWWWRISYTDPAGRRIDSANEIRVPVDREVEFVLTSPDVVHSFWVPSLGGKLDMIPGRTNILRLTAHRPGVYRGQCAEYCGGPHALMALEVIALPPDEFDTWLAGAAEPVTTQNARGQELFAAAGCGSCHAVRGTAADGKVGPDLSRLGERRRIAAATLPMTQDNIARFITDSQHVKPGNLMPNFRVLAADDLAAVSTYLAGLK